MRGWKQARTMNLEENGARMREKKSSSVLKIREWRRETQSWIVEALQNEQWKGWTNDEKDLRDLRERHMTDENSYLHHTLKGIQK